MRGRAPSAPRCTTQQTVGSVRRGSVTRGAPGSVRLPAAVRIRGTDVDDRACAEGLVEPDEGAPPATRALAVHGADPPTIGQHPDLASAKCRGAVRAEGQPDSDRDPVRGLLEVEARQHLIAVTAHHAPQITAIRRDQAFADRFLPPSVSFDDRRSDERPVTFRQDTHLERSPGTTTPAGTGLLGGVHTAAFAILRPTR
ncbi:hypothetical protein FAGKG844_40185 [Frankia sp. AgKG'84/4]